MPSAEMWGSTVLYGISTVVYPLVPTYRPPNPRFLVLVALFHHQCPLSPTTFGRASVSPMNWSMKSPTLVRRQWYRTEVVLITGHKEQGELLWQIVVQFKSFRFWMRMRCEINLLEVWQYYLSFGTSWFFNEAISQMKAKCPWLKCEALQSLMAFLLLINHWYLPIDPPTQGFWPWWHYSTTSALSHPPPLAKLLFDRWIDRWNHLPWSQGSGTGLKLYWSSDTKCKFNCWGRL